MGVVGIDPPKKNTPQEVQRYLNGHLKAELGLRNIQTLDGHNQNILADSTDGKLLVKFFREDVAHRASRCVLAHAVLKDHGVPTPELVYADLDPARRSEFKLSCVANRWVPGRPLQPGDQADACAAFKTLAMMHNIHLGDLDESRLGEIGFASLEPFQLPPMTNRAGNEVKRIRQVLPSISDDEAKRVRKFLRRRLKRLTATPVPRVLLHMDYQPANLVVTPGGELMVIDLELTAFGEFFRDLARAQFKFCFRTDSDELDRIGLSQLMELDKFEHMMNAYLSSTPPETREFWDAHFGTIVLLGYLRVTRRLAQRAHQLAWHRRISQHRMLKQAERRWGQLLQYVEAAAS